MRGELKGQTGIVTGASRGIGRAIARLLGEWGMRVVVASRDEEALEETRSLIVDAGGEALVVPTDVTNPIEVARLIERTEKEFGPLDLLVNNAGSLAALGPTWEVESDDWWQDITVNVLGVYLCTREALKGMRERNRGRIINMVGGGASSAFPFASAYATSKAAVTRFTETLATELNRTDSSVRVFALSPGFVRTRMTEQFQRTEEGRRWMSPLVKRLETNKDVPPEWAASVVGKIATGDLDGIHGRYMHTEKDIDNLDQLSKTAAKIREQDLRVLRIPT